jgi:hypothetical protein
MRKMTGNNKQSASGAMRKDDERIGKQRRERVTILNEKSCVNEQVKPTEKSMHRLEYQGHRERERESLMTIVL